MKAETQDNLLPEIVAARANFYHFFSCFFLAPPTGKTLQDICSNLDNQDIKETFSTEIVEDIISALKKPDAEKINIQEFHNLFLVPAGQYVAPYESCFRETRIKKGRQTKGLLMGKSTREVIRFYKENGFSVSPAFKDLPDHVVLELQFMATLCAQEQAAWGNDDRAAALTVLAKEKRFFDEHIMQWVPELCDEICAKSPLALYRGVAHMLKEFLEIERNSFAEFSLNATD